MFFLFFLWSNTEIYHLFIRQGFSFQNNPKNLDPSQETDLDYFGLLTKKKKKKTELHNIGIKHVFPCINVCQVPRELLKTEAKGRGFQQLPRDLANVNALEKNV